MRIFIFLVDFTRRAGEKKKERLKEIFLVNFTVGQVER